MASSPPFQVEDQTDEDFFDRLVNDDDDYKVIASSAAPNLGDSDVSDEVKAFANLSIGELGSESGNEVKGEPVDGNVKRSSVDSQLEELVDARIEESSSLVSSNSFAFDGVVETNDGVIGTDVRSDSTANTSSGSASSGVKEVQWSAFNADSVQNGSNGFGSYSDFLTEFGDAAVEPHQKDGDSLKIESKVVSGNEDVKSAYMENAQSYPQYQEGQAYVASTEQSAEGQDPNSDQYWENLYPGWKYDPNTGQWYQVDGYGAATNVQGSFESDAAANWAASGENSNVSYLQQATPSVVETVAESVTKWNQVSQVSDTSGSVSNWNQVSQENNGYPSHMVFDPQYPGWYYDTIAQEWRSLDTYTSSAQLTAQAQDQLNQNGFASTGTSHVKDQKAQGEDKYVSERFSNQGQNHNWSGSFNNINQPGLNMWQPETAVQNVATSFSGNYQPENPYDSKFSVGNHVSQQKAYDYGRTAPFYEKSNQVQNEFSASSGSQGFVPGGNFSQQFNQPRIEQNELMHVSNNYYGNQNSLSYSQQPFQSGHQVSYAPTAGRSSAGRPPHALVAFGFGGKLIVMKDSTTLGNLAYGNQESVGGPIYVHNLAEVVNVRADASNVGSGVYDYFLTLNRQSFPGPLTGGSVGVKELNKWIDEKITHSESSDMDCRKGAGLKLLFSLLKIACQHYGKLRSPFGTDSALKESDVPESAVAKLFASAKRNGGQFSEYGSLAHCLQQLPPEGQMRATAAEVQSLLVSGRKKEALHCAQEGQLWGPALVLAAQLGDQFYVDTVKQMALRQLVAGSPLRTLCLLIAGQPADVFSSTDVTVDSDIYRAVNTSKQPVQLGANSMLNDWEENLAVITANRTKDDELVLIHLGDCLWKERSEIIAAHICYLVAEANFEPYSDSARLCLVGADHWKFPRTYASPEAIQRTEIYEYSKALGNSQFILLPFQPYKLIYAHMLSEVGRVSDSLKYCQAVSKSLKTGRAPEVDIWRQLVLSLEERIRTHQQGGFSTNLAPAKLVGKLLNLFDSTAHRVVGGLPPPIPSTSVGSVQGNENYHQPMGPRVSTSQSTMAMSSLMPSASMEPISEWAADGSRRTIQNRSVSEPDFSRTPRQDQVESSKETTSASTQGKTSRFGRFGFGSQLLQKTVGLVLKTRQDKQAKLGETNKFYYDEKLKRWVEEGVDPPAEEAVLPPPPTIGAFPNGTSDYNLKSAIKSEGPHSNGSPEYKSPSPRGHGSGIPPIPPTSNQFSARGRMGVRSRYVDTFNQGGGNATNLFQSPSAPSIKSATTNPTFFVPTPAAVEPLANTTADVIQQDAPINENLSVPAMNDLFQSRPPSSSPLTMQRFASMDDISNKATTANNSGGSLSSLSRRTASWSGSFNDAYSPPSRAEVKPLGEVLSVPPTSFMPNGPPMTHSSMNGGSYGDDLHEVEL